MDKHDLSHGCVDGSTQLSGLRPLDLGQVGGYLLKCRFPGPRAGDGCRALRWLWDQASRDKQSLEGWRVDWIWVCEDVAHLLASRPAWCWHKTSGKPLALLLNLTSLVSGLDWRPPFSTPGRLRASECLRLGLSLPITLFPVHMTRHHLWFSNSLLSALDKSTADDSQGM